MMKEVFLSLLKRNGVIIAVFAVLTIAACFVSQFGMAVGFWAALFLMVGLIWANGMLVNHMSRLLAALLTAVITLVVGVAVVLLTMQIQKLFGK